MQVHSHYGFFIRSILAAGMIEKRNLNVLCSFMKKPKKYYIVVEAAFFKRCGENIVLLEHLVEKQNT